MVHARITQDRGKKPLGSPDYLENCQEFPACDSSALGGSFATSKRPVTGNSKTFLLTFTFSFLNRTLSFLKRICREVQIDKLIKILLQDVQLHALPVLVDKSPW